MKDILDRIDEYMVYSTKENDQVKKIIKVINSIKTQEQVQGVQNMIDNYVKLNGRGKSYFEKADLENNKMELEDILAKECSKKHLTL